MKKEQNPENHQFVQQKLFEIPSCSICLEELTKQLSSLACGHCFHFFCISQHLEYRDSCPYCQLQIENKQTNPLIFPLVQNTTIYSHFKSQIQSLTFSNKQKQNELQRKIQQLNQIIQNYQQWNANQEKIIQDQNNQIDNLKLCLLENQNKIKLKEKDQKQFWKVEIDLRLQIEGLKKKDLYYKAIDQILTFNRKGGEEITEYKLQLEEQKTEPAEKANIFYELALLKHINWLKQNKLVLQKNQQLSQQQKSIKILTKQLEDSNLEKYSLRLKCMQLQNQLAKLQSEKTNKTPVKGLNKTTKINPQTTQKSYRKNPSKNRSIQKFNCPLSTSISLSVYKGINNRPRAF